MNANYYIQVITSEIHNVEGGGNKNGLLQIRTFRLYTIFYLFSLLFFSTSFDLAESFSMTLPSLADSIMTHFFVRFLYL